MSPKIRPFAGTVAAALAVLALGGLLDAAVATSLPAARAGARLAHDQAGQPARSEPSTQACTAASMQA